MKRVDDMRRKTSFKIVEKKKLAPAANLITVVAPDIANKAQPGQFVVVRINENGERVPLTIADFEYEEGTITIIFQEIGKTTRQLARMRKGSKLADVIGPLGRPTELRKYGKVVCVGGGFGAATMYPIVRSLKERGNYIISIIGARNESLLIYESELRSVSDEVRITTDDGSKGHKGVVTDPLKDIISKQKIDLVMAIGPAIMMKFVSMTTKPFNVPTIVSLNPIMVDGTGMCGSCRVSVGGSTRFVCVDGPDFNGHDVDFEQLMARQRLYLDEEKQALEKWKLSRKKAKAHVGCEECQK